MNSADMKLHTEGNRIKNEAGETILLRGVNCAGLEWDAANAAVLPAVRRAIGDWHANVIRLPVSQDRWFGFSPEQKAGRATAESYREIVDAIVRETAERGAWLLLDLHWSDCGVWREKSGQQKMPDTNSLVFWQHAAARYRACGNVLFGLYNEPHRVGWDVWLDGGPVESNGETWEAVGMRPLLSAIRAAGAENLCVVGGLDWGYTFEGFTAYDALLAAGGSVVLDTHVYPWKRLDWDADVAEAAAHCPILVGECGHYGDDANPVEGRQNLPAAEWVPRLLTWIEKNGYHLTAWDFHPKAGPCLISDFDGTPTPYYGAAVREFLLAQSGK